MVYSYKKPFEMQLDLSAHTSINDCTVYPMEYKIERKPDWYVLRNISLGCILFQITGFDNLFCDLVPVVSCQFQIESERFMFLILKRSFISGRKRKIHKVVARQDGTKKNKST